MPDQRILNLFEALSDRFAALGGYDYDDPQEMDETGAPWMDDEDGVGLSLDEDGNLNIQIIFPADDSECWGWQIIRGSEIVEEGEIEMSWDEMERLESGPNSGPYRIGGKAAGELMSLLMDAAEAVA